MPSNRLGAGRRTLPFRPVSAARQRQAVALLLERGFSRPDALLDPDVIWRISPRNQARSVQDTNTTLLKQILDPDVLRRMGEATAYPGIGVAYQGIDLVKDLNRGLFVELAQPEPVIDLYRRDLQATYVRILVSMLSASEPETEAAARAGINDLYPMLKEAADKARDPQTQWHLKMLKSALESA